MHRYNLIWPRNVTEFSYRFNASSKKANVIMSFQVRERGEPRRDEHPKCVSNSFASLVQPVPKIPTDFSDVMGELQSQGYDAQDLR